MKSLAAYAMVFGVVCLSGCAVRPSTGIVPAGVKGVVVEIPLTRKAGQAAWSDRVTTKVKDNQTLVAKFDDPPEGWAGFGTPAVRNWSGMRDLSTFRNCYLEFTVKGTGVDQVRVKLKGPDDPNDKEGNQSSEVSFARTYDEATGLVKIPLREFGGSEFPWKQIRQVIFDTYDRKGPVDIEIKFPLVVADCE